MQQLQPMDSEPSSPILTPSFIIVVLITAMFFGNLISSLMLMGIAEASGTSLEAALSLSQDSSIDERNRVRVLQMMVHFFMFALPAILVSWFAFRASWPTRLGLSQSPMVPTVVLAILFIAAAFPLAQLVYEWNQAIPLPEWMSTMEEQADQMIASLLIMERWDELLFNILAVAAIPALGEELVFRGLVQGQLQRSFALGTAQGRFNLSPSMQGHLAVWVSAVLFSAIHMQFEGFFPRILLGAALGYLFLWTRNLWVPIAAHFFNNAAQVLIQYFQEPVAPEQDESFPLWIGLISLLFLLGIGYILYIRHLPSSKKPNEIK